MIAAVPVSGLLALACTLQDIEPLTASPIGRPHTASLVARDGRGAWIGWADVDGQDKVAVTEDGNGGFVLRGLKLVNSSDEIWATVIRTKTGYEMEWYVAGTIARDGRQTASVWSKGTCERLAEGEQPKS